LIGAAHRVETQIERFIQKLACADRFEQLGVRDRDLAASTMP
jgi:hypothetical protein